MKYIDITNPTTQTTQRHIIEMLENGVMVTFQLTDDNPNKHRLDAWLAEGNELVEWQPEQETN